MKNLLFTAVLFLFSITCFGQDRGYLGVSLGSSTPIGDFASTNPDNKAAGYAEAGMLYDFSFGFKFGKRLGFSTLIRQQSNPIDAQAFADQAAKMTGYNATVNRSSWDIGGYMLGGYGSFPVSEKVSVETKIMAGFLTASSPDLKVTLTQGYSSAWFKQNSTSAATFAYLISAGFKYNVGKHFCFLVNVDYLGANPLFVDVLTTSSSGFETKDTWSQKIETVNINAGVGFRFGKNK